MAITSSAKKALRQSKRKKAMNDTQKVAIRGALRGARAVPAGDKKASAAALAAAYKAIDKAAKRGLIKKNTASRRKAKVSRMLKAA
ncbi:MAG: ribosomal protein [Candidatus Adlerbacteria bacterium]|nr:ribosomal protein [Candidatus Adlerbacteria bacterium]